MDFLALDGHKPTVTEKYSWGNLGSNWIFGAVMNYVIKDVVNYVVTMDVPAILLKC